MFIVLGFMSNVTCAISIVSTGSQYEVGGRRFFFTVTAWEGGDKICNDLTFSTCGVSIVGAQYKGSGNWEDVVYSSDYNWQHLKPNASMAEVRKQLEARGGFSIPLQGSLFVPKDRKISKSFCITFAESKYQPGGISFVVPTGPCAPVILPALVCDIQGNPIINHGDISDAKVEGNEAWTHMYITCTGPSSVNVAIGGNDKAVVKLRGDEGLYSKITINNQDGAEGVNIPASENPAKPILVKSTLFTTAGSARPGAFSGFSVLTVSPP